MVQERQERQIAERRNRLILGDRYDETTMVVLSLYYFRPFRLSKSKTLRMGGRQPIRAICIAWRIISGPIHIDA